MENSIGFIRSKLDIKILVLFVLSKVGSSIDYETLTDLTMCDDGISYFDYSEALEELKTSEHIKFDGEKYIITAKGLRNVKIIENSISYSVRKKAEENINRLNARMTRDSLIRVEQVLSKSGKGYIDLKMSDGIDKLMDLRFYVNDEKQANEVSSNIKENAERIYNKIIEGIFTKK